MEYRGFLIVYPETRVLGTTFPYQVCLRSNNPNLASQLRARFGKNVPIVSEGPDLEDAINRAKQIADGILNESAGAEAAR